jgi:hypothetical protein
VDLGKPEVPKYCGKCGSELVRKPDFTSYNEDNGNLIHWYRYECPKRNWRPWTWSHKGRTYDVSPNENTRPRRWN